MDLKDSRAVSRHFGDKQDNTFDVTISFPLDKTEQKEENGAAWIKKKKKHNFNVHINHWR